MIGGLTSCISSESVADCQSSCGQLVEDSGSKKYSATHCSQDVVEGDNYLTAEKVLPQQTSNIVSTSSVVKEGDGGGPANNSGCRSECKVRPKQLL